MLKEMTLVEQIKYLMKKKGVKNQSQLSKLSGVPLTTLDGLLNTSNRINGPRIDTIEKICAGLGLTLAEFFSGVEPTEIKLAYEYNINEEEFINFIKLYKDKTFMKAVDFIQSLDEKTRDVLIKAIDIK